MEKITKYKAEDGKEFDSHAKCTIYENQLLLVKSAMLLLEDKPDTSKNDDAYVIQNKAVVEASMREVIKIAACYINYDRINEVLKIPFECRHGIIGRFIGDSSSCPKFIKSAWFRFGCISNSLKEYGQPYYAHKEDGT